LRWEDLLLILSLRFAETSQADLDPIVLLHIVESFEALAAVALVELVFVLILDLVWAIASLPGQFVSFCCLGNT
jgi:hypothetical protein